MFKKVANLLFEAHILKKIPRSGYHFLGDGCESVAEHVYVTMFIAFVMSRLEPRADAARLIGMCLVHDLPEARIGDLNYVHKRYVEADEERAIADLTSGLGFGGEMAGLIAEFNARRTLEAQLAHDADQLSLVLDLKTMADKGAAASHRWLKTVLNRLQTDTGRKMAAGIMDTAFDEWWQNYTVDTQE